MFGNKYEIVRDLHRRVILNVSLQVLMKTTGMDYMTTTSDSCMDTDQATVDKDIYDIIEDSSAENIIICDSIQLNQWYFHFPEANLVFFMPIQSLLKLTNQVSMVTSKLG